MFITMAELTAAIAMWTLRKTAGLVYYMIWGEVLTPEQHEIRELKTSIEELKQLERERVELEKKSLEQIQERHRIRMEAFNRQVAENNSQTNLQNGPQIDNNSLKIEVTQTQEIRSNQKRIDEIEKRKLEIDRRTGEINNMHDSFRASYFWGSPEEMMSASFT